MEFSFLCVSCLKFQHRCLETRGWELRCGKPGFEVGERRSFPGQPLEGWDVQLVVLEEYVHFGKMSLGIFLF